MCGYAAALLAADLLDHVEVLREQQQVHHVLRARAVHVVREDRDGVAQALDDGLALASDAHAGQVLALRLGLGGLDLQDLLRLGLLRSGHTQSLRSCAREKGKDI